MCEKNNNQSSIKNETAIKSPFKQFIFEDFSFDKDSRTLSLKYSFDSKVFFEEKIIFEFDEDSSQAQNDTAGNLKKGEYTNTLDLEPGLEKTLNNAFFSLWVMAGISYFKTYLPKEIIFKNYKISDAQKEFFEKVYFHGLGEFFAVNNINPHGKINFVQNDKERTENILSLQNTNQSPGSTNTLNLEPGLNAGDKAELNLSGNILLIGGGKDSLTSSALLSDSGEKYSTLTVDSDEKFEDQINMIHPEEHLKVSRKICPNLLRILKRKDLPLSPLNLRGADVISDQRGDIQDSSQAQNDTENKAIPLNGHVPISAIWAFLSVCVGILKGKKNIILSNEHSANEATMEFCGEKINHQYSKTLEFEKDFQHYVKNFITPEIKYFSLLRPLTELYIAEIFAEKCWQKFTNFSLLDKGGVGRIFFSSCNLNFKIRNQKNKFSWCGECPKCAFVFTIFAPFINKSELLKIFNNKNLFEDKNLEETFFELLGLRDQKPFECVGEIQEVRQAMYMALENFPELQKFTEHFENPDFEFKKLHGHSMPQNFYEKIYKNL